MRGLGLLQVLLFIMVLAGLTATGYLQWKSRQAEQTSTQEVRSLAQADQAIRTFVTVMRRMPCPDTNRDGIEDCGGTEQKGWLPTVSMRMAGADAGVSIGQIRYLVRRGAGDDDLTRLDDSWRPVEYDDVNHTFFNMRSTTADGGTYPADILTLKDICQRLDVYRNKTYATGMAAVNASTVRPVAYALAHPGLKDDDGNGDLFDGANSSATNNMMDDPERSHILSTYDDIVLERSASNLFGAYRCATLTTSVDMVALGLDVVSQVEDMRQDNISDAKDAIFSSAIGAALTTFELATTIIEAASDAGNAAADAVICGASLGLAVNACAAIGSHVAGAVLAGVSTVASVATIALNIAAAVAAGNALVLADSSSTPSSVQCQGVDTSQAIAGAKQNWDDAKAKVTSLESQVTAKQNELNAAVSARDASINNLYNYVRYYGYSSQIDFRVSNLLTAADDTWTTGEAYTVAQNKVTAYQDGYNNWNAAAIKYAGWLSDLSAAIAQAEADIASYDAQLSNPLLSQATKDALEEQKRTRQGELALMKGQATPETDNLPALQYEYNRAVTERNAAWTKWQAALAEVTTTLTNKNNASTAYQNAYSNLRTASAGPYQTYRSTAPLVVTVCTPPGPTTAPCNSTNSVNMEATIANGMVDLMGYFNGFFWDNGASAPNANSKYMRPKQLAKELAGLQSELSSARDIEAKAKKSYDDLVAAAANPPSCTLSGSAAVPMGIGTAELLLINVDGKGGTR